MANEVKKIPTFFCLPARVRISAACCALAMGLAACNEAESPALGEAGGPSQLGEAGVIPEEKDAQTALGDAGVSNPSADMDGGPRAQGADATSSSASADAMPNDAKVDATSPDANGDAMLPSASADAMPPSASADASLSDAKVDATSPGGDAAGPLPSVDAGALGDAQVPAPLPSSPKQLVLGRAHGCSLDPAISGLLCWGDNRRGQTKVPTLASPRFVAAGGDVTCAIDNVGVKCWGDNAHGQLNVPSGLARATQLAVGDGHVCALTAASAVLCWGDDTYGQLRAPVLRGVVSIGAGMRHSCALAEGGVKCWGDNALGQCTVPTLANPVQLAVGGFHNCTIGSGGVLCWGGSSPAIRDGMPKGAAPLIIAAGRSHSCVLDAAGVHCWGESSAGSLAPRELTNVRQLAVGGTDAFAHACARHQQGVACWGNNSLGQTAYDGRPLHILYRSEADINAPPAAVWAVLMDLPNYGLWNPYTIGMKSTLKIGDPMIMTVKMNSTVTLEQTEYIRVLDGRKACWGIDTTTPESNSGERCQWLEPLANGGTHYVTEDLIEGTLNPLVLALFGEDTRVGFDGVARALKTRVEALQKR